MTKLIKSPEELIKFHQEQMTGCEQAFVEHAYKCGEILKEKRRILGHGKFDEWVKEHWHKSKRTVNDYIALTGLKPVQILECTSIREAKSLLPKPPNAQHAAHLKPEDTEKTESEEIVEEANEIMSESAREATATPGGDSWGNVDQLVHDAEGILEDPPEGYEDVEDDEPDEDVVYSDGKPTCGECLANIAIWIKSGIIQAEDLRQLADQLDPPAPKKPAKRGGFQPPTVLEVAEYCGESGLSEKVQPEAFVDHFSSNGWKVGGKTAMKDWKAAVRNWARRSNSDKPDNGHAGPPKLTAKEQTRHSIRCDIFETDREWAVNATDEEIEAAIDAKL